MVVYLLIFLLIALLEFSFLVNLAIFSLVLLLSPKGKKIYIISAFLLTVTIILFQNSDFKNHENSTINYINQGFAYRLNSNSFSLYSSNSDLKGVLVYHKNADKIQNGAYIKLQSETLASQRTHNINSFDIQNYAREKGFNAALYCKGIEYIKTSKKDNIFRIFIQMTREFLYEKSKLLDKNASTLYKALILGILDSKETLKTLSSDLQIVHIFVISGFHFAFVVSIISIFLGFIFKNKRVYIIILSSLFAVFYYFISGGGIGSFRALFMILISNFCFFANRPDDKLNISILLASILMIINPSIAKTPSFQLSFISAFTLSYLSSMSFIKSSKSYLYNTLMLTIVVSLVNSLILISNGMDTVILSFLLIIFASSFVTLLMLIFSVYVFLPFLNFASLSILNFCSDVFLNWLSFMKSLSIFKTRLDQSIAFSILIFALSFLLFAKLKSHSWKFRNLMILSFIIIIFYNLSIEKYDFELKSYDLSDGECYLIKRKNKVLLYDVGNDKNIVSILKKENIKKIDLLIISHADLDHYGKYKEIFKNFKVLKSIVEIKENKIQFADLELRLSKLEDSTKSRNDRSIVLKFKVADKSFLLNGDIEEAGIKEYLENYNEKIDFLKIPHHGSYSENIAKLLDKTAPSTAIISGGRGKRINKKKVYDELNKRNIKVFDTNTQGQISIYLKDGIWYVNKARKYNFLKKIED